MATERGISILRPIKREDIKGLLDAPELPEGYVYVVEEAKHSYVRVAVVEIATGARQMHREATPAGPRGAAWVLGTPKGKIEAVAHDLGEAFLVKYKTDQHTKAMEAYLGAWGGGATS